MHILYMLYAICEAYFWATGLTRAKINTKQAKGNAIKRNNMLVCAMVENRNKGETTSERHRKIYLQQSAHKYDT